MSEWNPYEVTDDYEPKYDSFYGGWFGVPGDVSGGGGNPSGPGTVMPLPGSGEGPSHPVNEIPDGSESGRGDGSLRDRVPGNVMRDPPQGNVPGGGSDWRDLIASLGPWAAAIAAALIPGDGLLGSIEAGKDAYGWAKDKLGNWRYGDPSGWEKGDAMPGQSGYGLIGQQQPQIGYDDANYFLDPTNPSNGMGPSLEEGGHMPGYIQDSPGFDHGGW